MLYKIYIDDVAIDITLINKFNQMTLLSSPAI